MLRTIAQFIPHICIQFRYVLFSDLGYGEDAEIDGLKLGLDVVVVGGRAHDCVVDDCEKRKMLGISSH